MVAGSSMLVVPTMTPGVQDSILGSVRTLMLAAGLVLFCLGAILYLYVLVRNRTETATRLREVPPVRTTGQRLGENRRR
jgi:hypothetical protein